MRKTFKTILSCVLFGCVASSHAQDWTIAAETGFPGPSGGSSCVPLDATTSTFIFTAGYFLGSVEFGSTVLTSSGGTDAFLTRLSGSGVPSWAIKASGVSGDAFKKVEVAGANVFVYGTAASGSITFYGTSGAPVTLSVPGGGFLAKYTSAGVFLWAIPYAGTITDMAYSPASQRLHTIGVSDVSVFKTRIKTFNGTTGALLYDVTSTNTGYSSGNKSIAVDASGYCYILVDVSAGAFSVPGQPSTVILAATGQDLVLMKLDATLSYVTSKIIGNPGSTTEYPRDVDCSPAGIIYITGTYENGTTYMDGVSNPSFNLTNVGGLDLFLAKYDSNLATQWARKIAGGGPDVPLFMALDQNSEPYLLVQNKQYNSVTINPCPMSPPYTSAPISFDNKWYMVKYTSGGIIDWSASPLVEHVNAMPVGIKPSPTFASIIGYSYLATDFGSTSLLGDGSIYVVQASKMACKPGVATGIEESGSENELAVYPNPTAGLIQVTLNDDDKNVQVTITDNLGKQVMTTNNLETSQGELNVESLPAGIYFYTIIKNNVSYKGKIVKQ